MNFLPLALQIAALVCFVFAFTGWFEGPPPKPRWGWLGLFLWLLSLMITGGLHATYGVH
jgi:hypothetical protein